MAIVDAGMAPFRQSASETAGLKFAPETDASAKMATWVESKEPSPDKDTGLQLDLMFIEIS